jgi:hypothetical protein
MLMGLICRRGFLRFVKIRMTRVETWRVSDSCAVDNGTLAKNVYSMLRLSRVLLRKPFLLRQILKPFCPMLGAVDVSSRSGSSLDSEFVIMYYGSVSDLKPSDCQIANCVNWPLIPNTEDFS